MCLKLLRNPHAALWIASAEDGQPAVLNILESHGLSPTPFVLSSDQDCHTLVMGTWRCLAGMVAEARSQETLLDDVHLPVPMLSEDMRRGGRCSVIEGPVHFWHDAVTHGLTQGTTSRKVAVPMCGDPVTVARAEEVIRSCARLLPTIPIFQDTIDSTHNPQVETKDMRPEQCSEQREASCFTGDGAEPSTSLGRDRVKAGHNAILESSANDEHVHAPAVHPTTQAIVSSHIKQLEPPIKRLCSMLIPSQQSVSNTSSGNCQEVARDLSVARVTMLPRRKMVRSYRVSG